MTEGTDAQAEVSVRLEEDGKIGHRPRRRPRHAGRLGQGLCLGDQQADHAAGQDQARGAQGGVTAAGRGGAKPPRGVTRSIWRHLERERTCGDVSRRGSHQYPRIAEAFAESSARCPADRSQAGNRTLGCSFPETADPSGLRGAPRPRPSPRIETRRKMRRCSPQLARSIPRTGRWRPPVLSSRRGRSEVAVRRPSLSMRRS